MADFVDFLPYAWRYAGSSSVLQTLVTPNVNTVDKDHPIGRDPNATPDNAYEFDLAAVPPKYGWIFRDIKDQRPPRNVEGTGWASVLFSQYDHWSNQTRYHTAKFPILTVFIFADVTRDVTGSPTAQDAEHKVRVVWRAIDKLFHDAANEVHEYPGPVSNPTDTLRIVSSVESSPLSILDIPEGDGAVRGTVRYDITL